MLLISRADQRRILKVNEYCAFSKEHKCLKWADYEITRHELEEADELCHLNWLEIQRLYAHIEVLKSLLRENDIGFPEF